MKHNIGPITDNKGVKTCGPWHYVCDAEYFAAIACPDCDAQFLGEVCATFEDAKASAHEAVAAHVCAQSALQRLPGSLRSYAERCRTLAERHPQHRDRLHTRAMTYDHAVSLLEHALAQDEGC